MSGETILVVDDAVVNLKLIATVLRNNGYKVQLSSTAEQALSSLNTLRPDLVLADIQLPGKDGLDLRRRIRQQARLHDVVVIAMTASVALSNSWPNRPQLWFNSLRPRYGYHRRAPMGRSNAGLARTARVHSAPLPMEPSRESGLSMAGRRMGQDRP